MQAASRCGQEEPTAAAAPFMQDTLAHAHTQTCTPIHRHTHRHTHTRQFPASSLVNFLECLQLSLAPRVGAPRMSGPELLKSGPLGEGTQLGTVENGVLVPLSSGPGLR